MPVKFIGLFTQLGFLIAKLSPLSWTPTPMDSGDGYSNVTGNKNGAARASGTIGNRSNSQQGLLFNIKDDY